jgi:hypothetical protein
VDYVAIRKMILKKNAIRKLPEAEVAVGSHKER